MSRGILDEDTAGRSDLVDVEVTLMATSASGKAWLVRNGHTGDTGVWVPISECEFERGTVQERQGVLTLPEWLAVEKGLI